MMTYLAEPYASLKSTRRGKHVGRVSYYHVALVGTVPRLMGILAALREALDIRDQGYNVVKLDADQRISFLLYEDFEVPYPALLAAASCHLGRRRVHRSAYASRRNPPILHRKELLLPDSHPLVPEAERRTERLEELGAFRPSTTIGTRVGWQRRLDELEVNVDGFPLQ